QASAFFRGAGLPFPEPGVRLVPRGGVDAVVDRLQRHRSELADAVVGLEARFDALKATARDRLGRLYNPSDYPDSLDGLFDVAWDFPSVEPPDYLRRLSPDLYRRECERVQSRFDEAVRLAEAAFAEELAKLVEHLAERTAGDAAGRPKIFRDSAVENFSEFFARFRRLDVGSNEELERVVAEAERLVGGVEPQRLRDDARLRTRVAAGLASVRASLDDLLVDRPRRAILRKPK
ncbi:MAG: hypothetical protein ACRC1K_22505, partial [Planctomycetia bacterium]